jgi:hypothetical protein
MRRLLAAMVLLLLLAPKAWAQGYMRQPVQPAPTRGQNATQASYDTATLLALYMSQLANSGRAPEQSDIDEAARQYFTNGAAVSTVPTSGPGAAYFQNGASVMSYGGAPAATVPAPAPPVQPAAVNASATAPAPQPVPLPVPVPVNVPDDTATSTTPAPDTQAATSNAPPPPGVTEAQAANPTSVAATAPQPPAAAAVQPLYQTIVLSTAPAPAAEPESAPQCAPGPSLLSRLAPAFGGLVFGGLAVALWTRPRMLRDSATRSDVAPK